MGHRVEKFVREGDDFAGLPAYYYTNDDGVDVPLYPGTKLAKSFEEFNKMYDHVHKVLHMIQKRLVERAFDYEIMNYK